MPVVETLVVQLVTELIRNPGKTIEEVQTTLARAMTLLETAEQHIADSKPTVPDNGVAVEFPPDVKLPIL